MTSVLFAWIGKTDYRAASGEGGDSLGPIGQVLEHRPFDRVELLVNPDDKAECKTYLEWLASKTGCTPKPHYCALADPTNHEAILEAACKTIDKCLKEDEEVDLTFHLSPGTPSMHAAWLLLSKTRYPAKLVKSSEYGATPEERVKDVNLPFEISTDYFPEILKKSDGDLLHLIQSLPPEAPGFKDIIHGCGAMKKAVAKAHRLALRNVPALILGETGTGKELFARAIHVTSQRDGEFIDVNCGAIPPELVESTLFGYKRAAFSGAENDKKGCFEEADGGTIFLDEIGELPLTQQVKLLRVLEEKKVTPVGSSFPIEVDFRLITATHRNLQEHVRAGKFREDLFHRIAVGILTLPPLRDREGDLDLLIQHLWEKNQKELTTQPNFERQNLSAGAKNTLKAQAFPGNIRELDNILVRAGLWATGKEITKKDIEDSLLPSLSPAASDNILGRPVSDGLDLKDLMSEVARHYLKQADREASGNTAQAARLLGLSDRNMFIKWMEKYVVGSSAGI